MRFSLKPLLIVLIIPSIVYSQDVEDLLEDINANSFNMAIEEVSLPKSMNSSFIELLLVNSDRPVSVNLCAVEIKGISNGIIFICENGDKCMFASDDSIRKLKINALESVSQAIVGDFNALKQVICDQ